MIAATIIFTLPLESDWNVLRKRAKQRAKEYYKDLPGLITKVFILNPKTGAYGGMYVWENKKNLDAFLLSDAYRGSVEKLGKPEVKIFEIAAFIKDKSVRE